VIEGRAMVGSLIFSLFRPVGGVPSMVSLGLRTFFMSRTTFPQPVF
jgi:hypothetical protein